MQNTEVLTAEQKKKRRLARNRESARECRRRKKEYADSLARQLSHLEAENLQMRLKLKIGVDASTVHDSERDEITSRLNMLLQENGNDADMKKEIEELTEKYSDYGKSRRSSISFHLQQLRKCLLPTQTTRTLLWLITCAPMFHDSYGVEKEEFAGDAEIYNLWRSLLLELNPTPIQKKKLVDFTLEHRSPFPALQQTTEESNAFLDRLDELISDKHESLDTEMKKIRSILSPRQIAKFIVWIDQNPACMHMLEMIWPHIHLISGSSGSNGSSTARGGGTSEGDTESLSDTAEIRLRSKSAIRAAEAALLGDTSECYSAAIGQADGGGGILGTYSGWGAVSGGSTGSGASDIDSDDEDVV